jgi:hypothetical protein
MASALTPIGGVRSRRTVAGSQRKGGWSEAIATRDMDSTPPASMISSPAATRVAAMLNAQRLEAQK